MKLPSTYIDEMTQLLGLEMPEFLASFEKSPQLGLRVNTTKISLEEFEKTAPFPVKRIPWIPNGFFYQDLIGVSKHPYYFAGLYYLQEPSAMTPARSLPVNPGDCVLDLCAAPGGKATELAAKLQGKGFLIANDISNTRAKALLKNLELFGIANQCVISENPRKLLSVYTGFFDKILVDAPCSGEGMFRREPRMIKDWEQQGPEYYQSIQKDLISNAAQLLKPGGMILYSTCTFSIKENEAVIDHLLTSRDDMEMVDIQPYDGFEQGCIPYIGVMPEQGLDHESQTEQHPYRKCVRIFPHKMNGEGHFLALLLKKGQLTKTKSCFHKSDTLPKAAAEFLADVKRPLADGYFRLLRDKLYYLPKDCELYRSVRYLRSGLYMGEVKKNRFEPSQALAMSLKREEFTSSINLTAEDIRTRKYLKGETIDVSDCKPVNNKGWQLVCVDGFPLGWGKLQNQILKNKYYSGWRLQ